MEGTGIVFQRDFRELRQTNAFRVLVLISASVCIAAATGISIVLGRQPWLGEEAARPILDLIIGTLVYFLPFTILITFIWVFATLPIVKEKVSGNIESLLATPLTPKSIWMGKSLAIFLPGYVISVIATVIVLLAVNFSAIIPAAGSPVWPGPALLTGLLINPLLFFGLVSFMVLFSLANNPDIAIAPSFLLGFGIMIGIPLGLATGAINLASWSFALVYLGGTTVAWAAVIVLTRMLTKEKIVLSSKGE